MGYLKDGVTSWKNSFLLLHQQELCRDVNHLRTELQRIESLGGEGLMSPVTGINLCGWPILDTAESEDLSRCRSHSDRS